MRRILPVAILALAFAAPAEARQRDNPEPDIEERMQAPLVRAAGGYAVYQSDVVELEAAPFASNDDIDVALENMISHDPDTLAQSWMAYASLVAAQNPDFVDGVREVADYYGRDAVLTGMQNDFSYASQIRGADVARSSVLSAIALDAARIHDVGEAVRTQAYSIIDAGWANEVTRDGQARMAHLDEIALMPRTASVELLASLAAPGAAGSDQSASAGESFWGAFRLGPGTAHASETPAAPVVYGDPRYRPVLDQIITLAAFDALEAAKPEDATSLAPLMQQPDTQTCMMMARLHFQQCVAAAHFRYEDPFCIAEHGVKDVGDCFNQVVGQ